MKRDQPAVGRSGSEVPRMNIQFKNLDTETAMRRLDEELIRVQAAVDELERAKTVSRETLERTISV